MSRSPIRSRSPARAVCLCPEPQHLHRLPQVREASTSRITTIGRRIIPTFASSRCKMGGIDLRKGTRPTIIPCRSPASSTCRCNASSARIPLCHGLSHIEATWQEKDGIVVVDYNWCIGCRYCEAACPTTPAVSTGKPADSGGGHQSGSGLPVESHPPARGDGGCTFCLRTREGKMPAVLEACPTGFASLETFSIPTPRFAGWWKTSGRLS